MKKQSTAPAKLTEELAISELPSYSVTIGGQTYKLCFDLEQLCKARDIFRGEGVNINLMAALDVARVDPRSVKVLFALAANTFQPELGFESACKLVTIGSFYLVTTAILNAFSESKEQAFTISTTPVGSASSAQVA